MEYVSAAEEAEETRSSWWSGSGAAQGERRGVKSRGAGWWHPLLGGMALSIKRVGAGCAEGGDGQWGVGEVRGTCEWSGHEVV